MYVLMYVCNVYMYLLYVRIACPPLPFELA